MPELEEFKTAINLTEYAAFCGYELDRKESSRNSVVMRHVSGDKIIIARGADRHWIYFSVRDERDNGTIIDFLSYRQRLNLGQIRKALRPWIGQGASPPRPPVKAYVPELEPISRDQAHVLAAFARMRPVTRHAYLERRGILPELLASEQFTESVFADAHGNAVFPHYDLDGLCGYEIKNEGFTGFAKGGEKGLWISAANPGFARLVIAESAIDALSHAILFPDETARYASTAGKMNKTQPELIRAAILRLPAEGQVIAATDADAQGRELAHAIRIITEAAGRTFTLHQPPKEGTDWNDRLRPGRFPALEP